MEKTNEISKELLEQDDLQLQDMDGEDFPDLDYEEEDEGYDEGSEINPDYIFREDNQTFLLKNGAYQVLSDEVLDDIQRLRNEKN